MSTSDRLRERLLSELEAERHTHKSLRETLAEKYGYADTEISRAISTLNDEGEIRHRQGFFERVENGGN
ncbi:hypothetical protein [Natrinema marinum]|uniref:hypothetical protein n=1 Tax=Natrinema marinum TaxID=2961598 RepID=UPI0020C85E9C|nr:hypothetical protein [Natrinema marinum]